MTSSGEMNLADYIGAIPDFPKPGILFRDITPLLASPAAFREAVRRMAERAGRLEIDTVAAAEARGFLLAAPLALALERPLVPIRKAGKLPGETVSHNYELEYGSDKLEIRSNSIRPGARVLVVDDLLATGGTIEACCRLVEKAGGAVAACCFLIELVELAGASKIAEYDHFSLMQF